ncbi:MAG: hypothetical protein H6733_14370 [Alphaproteobacteria bacterium]|nr:hypothetical protein [Alphaproteobacteria bacterium]
MWILLTSLALANEIGPDDQRLSDHLYDGNQLFDCDDASVAAGSDTYLVVFTSDNSVLEPPPWQDGDQAVWAQRVDAATGAQLGPEFLVSADDGTAAEALWPDVAYNPDDDQFLVVWSGTSPTGDLELYGRRIDGSTGLLLGVPVRLTIWGVAGNTSSSVYSPRLVYNTERHEYVAVFHGPVDGLEDEIWAVRLSRGGTALSAPVSVMQMPGGTAREVFFPDIAFDAGRDRYLVVAQGDATADDYEVWARGLDGALGGLTPLFQVSDAGGGGRTSRDANVPRVAYNPVDDAYDVVWLDDSVLDGKYEVFARRVPGDASAAAGAPVRVSFSGDDTSAALTGENPDVAVSPAGDVLVTWFADYVESENFEILLTELAPDLSVARPAQAISTMGDPTQASGTVRDEARDPAVATGSTTAFVAWHGMEDRGSLYGEGEIYAQLWELVNVDRDGDGVPDAIDPCFGDNATGDDDGDGVCGDLDLCLGNDDLGDSDADGVCDDLDACLGQDAVGDDDGDGRCNDIDACWGTDATGDTDGDGFCDDIDVCTGDPRTGDGDGDAVCDDVDLCLGDDRSGDGDGDGVCDDRDFTLLVTDVRPGDPLHLQVYGATPGARVAFALTLHGPGNAPCVPNTTVCGDLSSPFLLGIHVVDAAGSATHTVQVPTTVAPGTFLFLQALEARAGGGDTTQVVFRVVQTPAP